MSDYIIPDCPFTKAYAKLAATGWALNLQSAHRPGLKGGTNSKTKFTCTGCGQNAWGKPDLAVICEACRIKILAANSREGKLIDRTNESVERMPYEAGRTTKPSAAR